MRNLLKPQYLVIAVLLLGVAAFVWNLKSSSGAGSGQESASRIKMPTLSAQAVRGQRIFKENCSRCHGEDATGTETGPPLIHDIYNPGHHGDNAFYRAVKQGSPQHHWNFGNMPPQTQVNDAEIASIIRFIREVQLANGIVYKEHRM